MLKAVAYDNTVDVYGIYPGTVAEANASLALAGLGPTSGFTYLDFEATQKSWFDSIQTLLCRYLDMLCEL